MSSKIPIIYYRLFRRLNANALRRYFRVCPAMFVLISYIFSSVGTVYSLGLSLRFTLCMVPPVVSCMLWGRKRLLSTAVAVLLGVAWAEVFCRAPWQSYLRLLPRRECSVAAIAEVIDEPEARHDGLCATMRIKRLKCADGWKECDGKLWGVFGNEAVVAHGDVIRLDGAMTDFDETDVSAVYRRIYGIRKRCVVNGFALVGHEASAIRGFIFRLRRKICERLTADFKDGECAGLYQAMILGMRSGMPLWSREVFIRSSSVHLFSISGLHILFFCRFFEGLLAALAVPRRYRVLVLVPVMLVYVAIAGGAPSALRSYYMLLSMTFAFLRNRQHSMENGLALSGLALLLCNPYYMMHLGFLYSFILVYCLLRARFPIQRAFEVLFERYGLIPSTRGVVTVKLCMKSVFSLICGGIVAWLGSVGIMMRTSCFIAYGAMIVNILLAPLASVLVFLAIPKVVAAMLSESVSAFIAGCIELLMKLLVMASRIGGTGVMSVDCAQIGLWMLLAYYVLLVIALSGMRPTWARICAVSSIIGMIMIVSGGNEESPRILVATGRTGSPPCIAVADGKRGATIVQLGDAYASRRMQEGLKRLGCSGRIYMRMQARREINGARQFPMSSIIAISIEPHAYGGIGAAGSFVPNAVSAGVHVSRKAEEQLNGVTIRRAGQALDVETPYGVLCILNTEDGVTRMKLPDGGVREYRQRLGMECEAIKLSRM